MLGTGSLDTLFNQAQNSIKEYFESACNILDEKFGDGYAFKNPELIGHIVKSMAIDLGTSVFRNEVNALADSLHGLTASTQ